MKKWTKLVVAGLSGYLFYATGDTENLVFVPLACIDEETGTLDEDGFLVELWPWANCFANPVSRYSHLMPDLYRPAPPEAPGLAAFSDRLAMRIRGTRLRSSLREQQPREGEGGAKAAEAVN